jgi:hypothetical protein
LSKPGRSLPKGDSDGHVHVGLDVHKASICIAVLNAAGKSVTESAVETSAATALDFLKSLRGRVEVTFEEGAHAAWLYDVPRKSEAGTYLRGASRVSSQMSASLLPLV